MNIFQTYKNNLDNIHDKMQKYVQNDKKSCTVIS